MSNHQTTAVGTSEAGDMLKETRNDLIMRIGSIAEEHPGGHPAMIHLCDAISMVDRARRVLMAEAGGAVQA